MGRCGSLVKKFGEEVVLFGETFGEVRLGESFGTGCLVKLGESFGTGCLVKLG